MGCSSPPSLEPSVPVKLTSLDQKLQLLMPLLSTTLVPFKLICVVFLPNQPVGILNRAKETRDEAQGQLKASLKTKPSVLSKTSSPAAKLSAGPIGGDSRRDPDIHRFPSGTSPAALERGNCNSHREEKLGKGCCVPSTAGKYSEFYPGAKKALSSKFHMLTLRFVPKELPVPNYRFLFNNRRAHGT